MYFLCSYEQLVVNKAILPLFVALKPENNIVVEIDKSKSKEDIEKLFRVLEQWFTNIKINQTKGTDNDCMD